MMDKFAQSLAMEDQKIEKNIYFDFHSEETSCMFKKAYVTSMKKPTGEKIKEHVANRLKSDFGINPEDIKITIKAEDSDGEIISKGDGEAVINLKGEKAVVPFKIIDGEISDFTQIKVGKETAAYNKQSIGQINKKSSAPAENDAFIGSCKTDNESTDRGFLDEVIKIRDNHVSKQVNSNAGRYITASEACDEILSKTASIKETKEHDYAAVEAMVREKVASVVAGRLEKIASIDIDKKVSHAEEVFAKMERLPLKSVHTMKHGQTILFPEVNGNEISMTAGIVFKKIDKDYYKAVNRYSEVNSDYTTIVASHDGRIALLGSGQTMLALEDDSAKFKLPSTRIKAVEPKQTYFAVVGDSVVAPFYIKDRFQDHYGASEIVKELSEVLGVHDPIIDAKPAFTSEAGWGPSVEIVLIPGERFATHLKKVKVGGNVRYINGATNILKKTLSHKPNLLASVSSMINLETATTADPDTKVVKVKGLITGYISHKNELNPNINRAADHIKLANYDTLRIEKVAKDKDEYSVKVNGKNKKDFGSKLTKKETQTVMLSMGYKPDEIGEAMNSVKTTGKYHKQLPKTTNINKLYDGEVETRTQRIMKEVKKSVFDKEKAKDAAKNFGFNMTTGTLGEMATENDSVYAALEYLSKFAKESEAAAIAFEKFAMEYKSEELQNVAKTMVAANNLFTAVKQAYEGKELSLVKEACEAIVANKDCLDELTTGVIGLSEDQFAQSDEYVPYEVLRTATEVMGGMYELAKQAGVANQDIMCIECEAKVDEPLKNGRCSQCVEKELASLKESEKDNKSTDDKEIKGDAVGEEEK